MAVEPPSSKESKAGGGGGGGNGGAKNAPGVAKRANGKKDKGNGNGDGGGDGDETADSSRSSAVQPSQDLGKKVCWELHIIEVWSW